MAEPLIEIRNVSKIYTGQATITHALDNVSMTINAGEVFGLLGVNGAGKTTLSSILATLHPPTSGDVTFKGVSIYNDLYRYRRALGFCPQHQNLDPFLNVRDNLLFAGRYFLMPEDTIVARAQMLMEQLDITRFAAHMVNELSGGNKQRVLIARALMHNPEIVILDEPTVGLDPDIRRKLWNQIKNLKQSGVTVVLTTHYLDEAEELSDRICILNKGKILITETMENLKNRHARASLEDIFIDITQRANHDL